MKHRFVSGCSFCGKPVNKVKKLIGTPKHLAPAYICDECIAVCNSILEKHSGPADMQQTNSPTANHGLHRGERGASAGTARAEREGEAAERCGAF